MVGGTHREISWQIIHEDKDGDNGAPAPDLAHLTIVPSHSPSPTPASAPAPAPAPAFALTPVNTVS